MAKKKGKKLKDQEPSMHCSSLSQKVAKKDVLSKKKKLKKKQKKNAYLEAPYGSSPQSNVHSVTSIHVSTPSIIAHGNEVTEERKKDKEAVERSSGFIFMCNEKTKPECYQNRVFGLPAGQLNIVEKIKPGAKLFLFDFDLKILYGVYKATSRGELNLEPTAFNGRYPAQVRFKIFKECLPLAENAFKHAIKDNYLGPKFRQDLNNKQVKALVSLFRPLSALTSAVVTPKLTNVVYPHTLPVLVDNGRFQLPTSMPPADDSYLRVHPSRALPIYTIQSELMSPGLPIDRHGPSTHIRPVPPALEPKHGFHRTVQSRYNPPHYMTNTHQFYLPDNSALHAEDSYGSYELASEVVQRDQTAAYRNEYCTSQPTNCFKHSESVTNYYNQNLASAAAANVPLQRHPQKAEFSASYWSYNRPTVNDNPHQEYASSSLQRPVLASLPVSSHYAFAGAHLTYR